MTSDRNPPDGDKGRGRFRPGQSGNPKGRPKKIRTVSAAISGAFSERVSVTERGQRRNITKLEAAAKQITNKLASGDLRSAKLAFDLAQKAEQRQSSSPSIATLSESDQKIAERFVARLRQIFMEESNGQRKNSNDAS